MKCLRYEFAWVTEDAGKREITQNVSLNASRPTTDPILTNAHRIRTGEICYSLSLFLHFDIGKDVLHQTVI
jgi:hypothetical protein